MKVEENEDRYDHITNKALRTKMLLPTVRSMIFVKKLNWWSAVLRGNKQLVSFVNRAAVVNEGRSV